MDKNKEKNTVPRNVSCAVPFCKNTKVKCPEKFFFSSPSNKAMRSKWLLAMRRKPSDYSISTKFNVCEDHFNLERDLKNYVGFVHGGYKRRNLKEDVVPSEFDCQPDRKRKVEKRVASVGRIRKKIVENLISESVRQEEATSTLPDVDDVHECPSSMEKGTMCTICTTEKGAQCSILKVPEVRHFRSKMVQTDSAVQYYSNYFEPEVLIEENLDIFSPLEAHQTTDLNASFSEPVIESEVSSASKISSEYIASVSAHDSYSKETCNYNTPFYLRRPREYLGITEDAICILDVIQSVAKCSIRDTCIILMKIRKSYTFTDLADRVGLDERTVRNIFAKCILKVAEVLKRFILWPSPDSIKLTLPIPFRLNFRNIQGIIDCYEIEIQKPQDPVLQSLTWSDYKHCNSIKYLICVLPNGRVVYISTGFGGRTSDIEIVKKSGFLQTLPTNACIMADRGFKGVEALLLSMGCKLVRPPSVPAGTKLNKQQVRYTKQVASLRIHVERAIRRAAREFNLLKCHSSVQHNLIKYLDECVIITAALANLQPPLIKCD